MNPSPFRSSPFSRRRVLSLAAGATAFAVAAPARRIAAQVTPIASPVAAPVTVGTPVAEVQSAAPLPMPSTLAAYAAP